MSKYKSTPQEIAAFHREQSLIKQNRDKMSGCKGCGYLGTVLSNAYFTCDYTLLTGKQRPCSIEGCTVKAKRNRPRRMTPHIYTHTLICSLILVASVLFSFGGNVLATDGTETAYNAVQSVTEAQTDTASTVQSVTEAETNTARTVHFAGWKPLRTALLVSIKPSRTEVLSQFSQEERYALAKLLWGEARGIKSQTEQAAVIWCVLNRVDSDDPYYPDTILGVVKQPGQFAGYSPKHPVDEKLLALVDDVLYRWATDGEGRVLPSDYLFFASKASEGYSRNYFRKLFRDPGPRWDWSLPSPYES